MKSSSRFTFAALKSWVWLGLVLLTLTGCELPPREAWNIIQRDGLITYWSREYNPRWAPSRYLASDHRPFIPRSSNRVPYRPRTEQSRYLAEAAPQRSYRAPMQPTRTVERTRSIPAEIPPVKIPLEPSRTTPPPSLSVTPPVAKSSMAELPYGTPVPGRPGMVNSPFAEKQQLVDVTGMAPGEAVKDPYTGKLFRVPPTEQAAASETESVPVPEPKEEAKPQP